MRCPRAKPVRESIGTRGCNHLSGAFLRRELVAIYDCNIRFLRPCFGLTQQTISLLARVGGTWLQHTLSVAVLCAIHHELEIIVQVHSLCNARKKIRMSVDNGCDGASTVKYKKVRRTQRTHSKQDHVHQREASRRGRIPYAVK